MRSLVRWAGSKKKLLPKLSEYWPVDAETRYLEAFAGSASLFFHVAPRVALLNDLNSCLIEAYTVLRDRPDDLFTALALISRSPENYYEMRALDPATLAPLERAVRFFYLNRLCFNGIYRTNKAGGFNVPYGGEKSGAFPTLDEWRATANLLAGAKLSCLDFEEFLRKNVRKGDFVYLDPPYAVSNRRIFRQYSAETFGLEDVSRLASVLDELDARGATFVVSYAKSPETRILAGRWHRRETMAQRNVAGFAHHRRKAMEVILTNIG